jgi:hypothetical protein
MVSLIKRNNGKGCSGDGGACQLGGPGFDSSGIKRTDGEKNWPQLFKVVETYTDMTIHWKALEEHCLMVPLVFQ